MYGCSLSLYFVPFGKLSVKKNLTDSGCYFEIRFSQEQTQLPAESQFSLGSDCVNSS